MGSRNHLPTSFLFPSRSFCSTPLRLNTTYTKNGPRTMKTEFVHFLVVILCRFFLILGICTWSNSQSFGPGIFGRLTNHSTSMFVIKRYPILECVSIKGAITDCHLNHYFRSRCLWLLHQHVPEHKQRDSEHSFFLSHDQP